MSPISHFPPGYTDALIHQAQPHFPANPFAFDFDASVTPIFDEMAHRAIPGYEEAHQWIRHLLQHRSFPQFAHVWDFGCSTGNALKAAMEALDDPLLQYHGCDLSASMVAEAQSRLPYAKIHQSDLTKGLPAAVCENRLAVGIFAWTLQFLPERATRCKLLADAYAALLPDGKLFVFEKFQYLSPVMQQAADRGYYWFRRRNGYGIEEIEAKTQALAHSMFPWEHDTLEILCQSFPGAEVHWLYRHYQFGGLVVTKRA